MDSSNGKKEKDGPKMRAITINESLNNMNKLRDEFIISLWGAAFYLNYPHIPQSQEGASIQELDPYILEFIKAKRENDEDEIEDFKEWADEGCRSKGKYLMPKDIVDEMFWNASSVLEEDLTLYRTGDIHPEEVWVSMSRIPGQYEGWIKAKEEIYEFKKGDQIVETHGWEDKGEVIVNTKYI